MPKKVPNTSIKFSPEAIKSLVEGVTTTDELNDLFKDLKRRLINEVLSAEMENHLGYDKHSREEKETPNRRNGSYEKTLLTNDSRMVVEMPRDRECSFSPQIVAKGLRRLDNRFDEKVISLYSRGMSMSEIQGHLEELYDIPVSAELISNITDTVMEDVRAWQNRPLDSVYPIVYLDCLFAKCRESSTIINKAVYVALGVTMEGNKEVLGLWISKTEGAKFWMSVINELKNRGVQDIFIACIDGLTGFEEAIHAIFPHTIVQACIVHMVRNSLKFVPWKDKKEVAASLKQIYIAPTEQAALQALEDFKKIWGDKYPTIPELWYRNWEKITPFLAFPDFIRKAIYTTNAIEATNRQIRKIIKTKSVFPNDDAVLKIIYLALKNAQKKWTMPIRNWTGALNQFAILFAERMPK